MKKIIAFSILVCLMMACVSTQTVYRTDNYNRLSIGMSKWEVENWIGPPLYYLDAGRTLSGYEEIVVYRNRYNRYFALEFINDYLVAADYIYDGGRYPMYSYHNRPAFGRPVFPPNYRPNRPYYPPSGVQPGHRPSPPSHPQQPNHPNHPQRPPANTRPDNHPQAPGYERPSSTTRPSAKDRPASKNERPAPKKDSPASKNERPASKNDRSSSKNNRSSSSGTSSSGSKESTRSN